MMHVPGAEVPGHLHPRQGRDGNAGQQPGGGGTLPAGVPGVPGQDQEGQGGVGFLEFL